MASSRVYFTNLRASFRSNILDKVVKLLEITDLRGMLPPRSLVAIKLHFGEKGNIAFVRPNFIRRIVDYTKGLGAYPFLTDTNTLYAGTRGNSVSHLNTAIENGFAYAVVDAPIIIADGMRGASSVKVRINKEIFKTAFIGKEIFESDALISVAHFKGHDVSGFGGSIKNLGMGCASKKGKLEQHSGLSPKVKRKKCAGCGDCVEYCAQKAISIEDEKAMIDSQKCSGCGECIIICPNNAINVRWNSDSSLFQKKMVEYAFAAMKGKRKRSVFLNFLIQISPACDCPPFNDAPIVQDLGIMASRDPVAVDQASVDMVNGQAGLDFSCLKSHKAAGDDKFRGIYPEIDWSIQLDYADEIGLGNRDYELVTV
ncbi:DUF362 domain-containing protein [Thermodesulfobacteriota bacterium]